MILSRASEYAIRAMVYMAGRQEEGPIQLKEIAEAENIPFHFLAKTMQVLTRIRLVKSFRGPHGGFTLMKPSSEIHLYEIVNAFDAISQVSPMPMLRMRLVKKMGPQNTSCSSVSTSRSARAMIRPCLVRSK